VERRSVPLSLLGVSAAAMGLLSNRVERSEIRPGDHIYTWRAVYAYSHHGTQHSPHIPSPPSPPSL
jgi:hypothetical protein